MGRSPRLLRGVAVAAVAIALVTGGLLTVRQPVHQEHPAPPSEQFSRLAEQLRSGSLAVRVQTVHAFGRLMRESRDDQQRIVEILCTFVRIQTVRAAAPPSDQSARPLPADIAVTLMTLDGQPQPRERTNPDDTVVTWRAMYLDGVDLSHFDLSGVALREANLGGVNLSGSKLRAARLWNSRLFYAKLAGADLSYADLTNAELIGADLSKADLSGAKLADVSLTGADLSGADLTGTDLTEALGLDRANLTAVRCSASTRWPGDLLTRPRCSMP